MLLFKHPSNVLQRPFPRHKPRYQHLLGSPQSIPVVDILIRLVGGLNHPFCHSRALLDHLGLVVYFKAAVDIASRAKRSQGLGAHVAEQTIRTNKVRAPGSF